MRKISNPESLFQGDEISYSDPDSSSEFIPWIYWNDLAREEWWKRAESFTYAIFSEKVMGVITLILILDLILSDFVSVPSWMPGILDIIDIAIWILFILEYLCKLLVAPDKILFIKKPWHVVDLLIIIIPLFALIIGTGYTISRYIRILRGVQVLQVIIRSGYTAKKHLYPDDNPKTEDEHPPMEIRKITLGNNPSGDDTSNASRRFIPCSYDEIKSDTNEPVWTDISFWTFEDLKNISNLTHMPIYMLESKLRENAYPRADIHDLTRSFFIKIPVLTHDLSDSRKWRLSWPGLLMLTFGSSIITISKERILPVEAISSQISGIKRKMTGDEILYLIIKDALGTIDRLITIAEEQLVFLEKQQVDLRPPNFLKMVYKIRKELGNMVSWLLHTKEGLGIFLDGSHSEEERRIRSLMDQCNTLSDNTSLTQTAFTDLSGYYLDYNGYQMNRVMKFLAVLTALTMFPALIGSLLGMNLIDQPWSVTLAQIGTIVCIIMLFTGWVYYKIGWISR